MGNIFISYRREDSAGHTGRLFDRLREHFGKDRVFMDIAGIEPGVDFVEAIEKAVGSCDAFIVVIGKQWLNVTDADGRRRLDNPEDFIRLELATALRRNVRVIPVLVQGAATPSSGNLPEDLKKLSRLQGHEITDNRWDYDVGTLVGTLEKVLRTEKPQDRGGKDDTVPKPFKLPRWAIAVIAAIVIAVVVYAIWPPGKPGIEMPNVIGEPFDKAKAVLTEKGLEVSREEKQTNEKPSGIVIDQKPKPGTEIKRGQRVDLVLAVRVTIEMPNLLGRRIDEAKALLRKAGLAGPDVKEIKSGEKSPGVVLDQNPKPGAKMEPGQKVLLEVAVKAGISVPNVVGEQLEKAKTFLAEKGLRVSKIEKQTDEKPPGTVLDQNPRPGKEVEKGQRVELVIASEPTIRDVTVPYVLNRPLEEAGVLLEKAGLRVAAVKERGTNEKPAGIVLAQSPKPGTVVPRGENIELVIAWPLQTTGIPSVEDLSRTQYSLPGDSVIHFRVVEHQGLKLTIEVEYNYNERHGDKVMVGAWLKPSELLSGYTPTYVPHPGKGTVRVPISIGKQGVSTEIEVFLYEWGRPSEVFARRNFPYKMRFE